MKTLCLFLLTLTLTLTGCGGDAIMPPPECLTSTDCGGTQACNDGKCVLRECTVSTDCSGTQRCDLGVCVDQECWSDNDCPLTFKCADGVCVEKPECIKDEECDVAQGLFCLEYKCVPYINQDQCNGLACDGVCANCGLLTYCYEGTCQDACIVDRKLDSNARTDACIDKDSCDWCYCWNHGQLDWNTEEHKCVEYTINPCTEGSAKQSKNMIDTNDWEAISKSYAANCT